MALPEFYKFIRPVLEILADGKPRRIRELYEPAADYFNLSELERAEMLPSGVRTRVQDRVTWAGTYLRQAKLIEKVGSFENQITQRGKAFLKTAPEIITAQTLMQFPEFAVFQSREGKIKDLSTSGTASVPAVQTPGNESFSPEEAMSIAAKELFAALQSDLLEQVMTLSPSRFESLVVQLMLRLGYGGPMADAGIVLGKTGDEGVDGVISQDKLGLDKIYLQAKRYTKNAVGAPDLNGFVGALAGKGASKGVFITTSDFTKAAEQYVGDLKTHKISLINGEELARLMIETNLGVSVKTTYEVKRVDSDFFAEE
jgi:restriction system protein